MTVCKEIDGGVGVNWDAPAAALNLSLNSES